MNKDQFLSQFRFDPSKAGYVGVEREQFIVDNRRQIVPYAPAYMTRLESIGKPDGIDFGYELSACQVESKIGPCELADLSKHLSRAESHLELIDTSTGLNRINIEVAPEDMPLSIYPDPTGRYQRITKSMPSEILSAACRVAATHIHIGVRDIKHAIRAYNSAIQSTDALIQMGDGSHGERISLYRKMAKEFNPLPLESPDEFYTRARTNGYDNDPRCCWTIIRISIHGTIEFRMFGATQSIKKITEWANICKLLCC